MDEIQADIAELQQLLTVAARRNVRNCLANEISKMETTLKQKQVEAAANEKSRISSTSSNLPLNKIINYAWDQSEKFVKLYVTIPGVQNAPKEQILVEFKPKSLAMSVKNVDGKNHELQIIGLLNPIDPETSQFKLKTDSILLMLKKKAEGKNWDCVTEQEYKTKEKSKPNMDTKPDEDPSTSMMKMMKQMYNEGDDEMKRSIRKAWCESQEKKRDGPMLGNFDT